MAGAVPVVAGSPVAAAPADAKVVPPGDPLVPSNVAGNGAFGSDVALDPSGSVALVGAPLDGGGSATLFRRVAGQWVEVARLAPEGGEATDLFGAAVALDGDGQTAVVGAPGAAGGDGVVYVFEGPEWDPADAVELPAPGAAAFGTDVAVDGAGEVLIAGSPGGEGEPGSAWVFTGPDWLGNPVIQLAPDPAQNDDRFGESVTIDSAGTLVAVGAPGRSVDQVASGAVFVFGGEDFADVIVTRPLGSVAGDRVGASVSLAGDGSRLLVGAPGAGGGGAAWRFEAADDFVDQTAAMLLVEAGDGDAFGSSVALTTDGDSAAVGASGIPGAFLFDGLPDPAEAEANPFPPGPHGFALAVGGPHCLAGVGGPAAGASTSKGVVPGSAANASFTCFGQDITGTVRGQFDPDEPPDDPPDGFRQAQPPEVRVSLFSALPNGQRGVRVGVPQYLDSNLEFGFGGLPPGDYVVVAEPTQNAGHGHSLVLDVEQLVTFPPPVELFEPPEGTGALELGKQVLADGDSIMEPAIRQTANLPAGATELWHGFPGSPTAVAFQACPGGSGTVAIFSATRTSSARCRPASRSSAAHSSRAPASPVATHARSRPSLRSSWR